MMVDIKKGAWDNFMTSFDYESDESNFRFEFKVMTKKFGQCYIEYCRAMWKANEGVQTEEEFCRMNGNMPMGFFNGKVKNA